MIIKEAEYKEVQTTRREKVSEAIYGCDECKTEMKDDPNEHSRLELKVFHEGNKGVDYLHLCSWDCVLKHLPKIKTDYFVDLPFLYYDEPAKSKRSVKHLISIIKKLKS